MSALEPIIRNISDTALWAAVYRARESERPDAIVKDPLARRLAGARGEQIADAFPFGDRHAWTWVTRTYLFDGYIREQVKEGADMVVNLAAGLDTRPYRMDLPSSLLWVEVDLPDLLDYKEEVLTSESPRCRLERVRLDLSNRDARRALFRELGARAKKALIVTEGLIIYLTAEQVGELARDLALDLASPGLLRLLQRELQPRLTEGGAKMQFGPKEGPLFFLPYGWKPLEVRALLKTAARLRRLSLFMRLLALLPASNGEQGSRPWSGICLFARE
jgi:O-methyltransferase involved in polyketide biosynthesis